MCSGFFYFFFMDFFDIGFVLFLREALICLGIGLTRGRFENFVTNWISVFCLLQNLWKVLLFVEPGNLYFSCYFNSPNLQKATGMESVFLFYPFLLTVVTVRNLSIFQLTVLVSAHDGCSAELLRLTCCVSVQGLHPSEEHLKADYVTAPHEGCSNSKAPSDAAHRCSFFSLFLEDAPLLSFKA